MPKQKLSTLIKQLNEENAPPAGWTLEDSVQETVPHVDVKEANKPEAGKTYALTGGPALAALRMDSRGRTVKCSRRSCSRS